MVWFGMTWICLWAPTIKLFSEVGLCNSRRTLEWTWIASPPVRKGWGLRPVSLQLIYVMLYLFALIISLSIIKIVPQKCSISLAIERFFFCMNTRIFIVTVHNVYYHWVYNSILYTVYRVYNSILLYYVYMY